MRKILAFILFLFSVSVACDQDSAYVPMYEFLKAKYPSYKPYPVSTFPFFMVPDSVNINLPRCNKKIYLDGCSYDIRICGELAHEKHFQVALKYGRSFKLCLCRVHPVSKIWEEYRPPITVKIKN